MRLQYEIGARGTDELTEKFCVALRNEFGSYYTGRYREETIKSVSGRTWEEPDEFVAKAIGWCMGWSQKFPELEVFLTVSGASGGFDEVRYATFERGELVKGTTLIQHDRFVEELGDCDCTARPGYYEKYPTETPFRDCPIRLNPPTAWAVENIMYAHERIGMR